jgi:simple sugar transport system permease protein
MDAFNALIVILASGIRLSVPLIFACLAGLWSERSGIVDIGLEGKMLTGAFAAAAVAIMTGSAWAGLGAGIAASILISLIHGYASIDQRANQIVSGTAINMVADGMTALIGNAIWAQGGRTPQLDPTALFNAINLPFAESFGAVPILGPIYQHLISGHDLLTYLAFALAPATYWVLYKTRFGLRLRAVGENPAAVDTAGISVRALRYSAVIICGVLVGMSGVYLSIAQAAYFQPHMSAGKGFIALAALVFAKWRPMPALATCLLFGFLDALSIRLQGVTLPGIDQALLVTIIQSSPYILTVILLAGFIGKAIPPKASGVPYVKER